MHAHSTLFSHQKGVDEHTIFDSNMIDTLTYPRRAVLSTCIARDMIILK